MVNGNYSEIEVTSEEFNKIIKNNNLVVANFYAEWHMSCLMISPVLEDLAEQMKEIIFIKINIEDNVDLVEKHSISTMPCLVVFKNGQEIHRIIGSHSPENIEMKIKGCLN
jgi:thioredoxin 1